MFSYSEFRHNYTKSVMKFKEPLSADYKVYINGNEIPVYTCRISKYPFNRIWPGFQRPFEQSEGASFVNIVSDEELNIEVAVNYEYKKAFVKPYSKDVECKNENGRVSFKIAENGQYVLECDSYRRCLYIFNSKPIAPPKKENVTYWFGPGIYFPQRIELKSHESIYVDKDALVYGWIYAENAEDIKIFGNGVLDGSGEARVAKPCYENYTNGNLKFYDCKDVAVEGVLLRDSAIWCVNLFHCENVLIDNIKVFGQWKYNTDGIDIVNSQRIDIRNSFVHSFDDTITIKGIDRYIKTDNRDITVDNCVLWCDWGRCMEIGFETACNEYRNITFKNSDILRGGAAALEIQNGDCADVSDIIFENINVEYNSFDTPEVYQDEDDTVYDKQNENTYPLLLSIANHPFRSDKFTLKALNIPIDAYHEIGAAGRHGRVHGVTYKNINVYYDKDLPLINGKPHIPVTFKSSYDDTFFKDITVTGITVNGKPLRKEDIEWRANDTIDLKFENSSVYTELEKNTVAAKNQLKESEFVRLENPNGSPKFLFAGNSITLHGIRPDIGWNGEWGMAASAKENDYVHILMKRIRQKHPNAAFCICQVAEWERRYKTGEDAYKYYENARDFCADVIIARFIENCPADGFDSTVFKKEYARLLDFLDKDKRAKRIITTGFWHHPGDSALCEYAKENGYPFILLGDLGDNYEMKALGLFEHEGIANHPGDKGMKAIAERIAERTDKI